MENLPNQNNDEVVEMPTESNILDVELGELTLISEDATPEEIQEIEEETQLAIKDVL